MENLISYTSIIISFTILAALCLWMFVKKHTPTWLKVLIIPLCLWYGAAMYFAIPNIMGWPTRLEMPNNTILLDFHIVEPSHDTGEGSILIFGFTPAAGETNISIFLRIDPRLTFSTYNSKARLYEIPYTREKHDKLLKARKEAQKAGNNSVMIYRKGKKGKKKRGAKGSQYLFDNGNGIEVLNPSEVLSKPNEE